MTVVEVRGITFEHLRIFAPSHLRTFALSHFRTHSHFVRSIDIPAAPFLRSTLPPGAPSRGDARTYHPEYLLKMSTTPFRPLTFGEILDGAFTLYRRHFLTFFITALVPYVPVGVLSGWLAGSTPANPDDMGVGYILLAFAVGIVSLVALAIMWVALTREAAQAYTGGEVSLADAFRQGWRSFFFALIAGGVAVVVIWFGAVAMFFAIGLVAALLIPAMSTGSAGAGATAVIGIFSFVVVVVVFGLILGLFGLFFAVVPAIVVERRGPFEAIGRSLTLAWGALPRVVGVTVVSSLALLLPILGLFIFLAMTEGVAALMGGAGAMSPGAIAIQQLATTVVYALVLPFFATSFVLLYFDRRARTESNDLEGMVAALAMPAPGSEAPRAFGGA
jgi:hypothetical protein